MPNKATIEVRENGRIKESTNTTTAGIKSGFILTLLTVINKYERKPSTPVVARSSKTKLEDRKKERFQIFGFRLNAACLNLVKSVKYVPNPEPRAKLLSTLP